jgi:hypothetical protein
MTTVLDEASRPSLREVMGRLLAAAGEADLAITHVRLSAVDLTPAEAGGIRRCRFLLGRLEAAALAQIGDGAARSHLVTLRDLLRSGRVEIRSAGLGVWLPDFSVYRGLPRGAFDGDTCIIGAHYFRAPHSALGPSLTCVTRRPEAVLLATRRFAELWQQAHDVRPAVMHAIERLVGSG